MFLGDQRGGVAATATDDVEVVADVHRLDGHGALFLGRAGDQRDGGQRDGYQCAKGEVAGHSSASRKMLLLSSLAP